uniref:bacteriocin n=2 Tax=Flavobacterium sp. TaxID=239 RepID=UPI0040481D8F
MNLENLNLVELNAQEIVEIEGGIPPVSPWWGWIAITVAVYDLAVGIHEGIQEGQKERCGC